VLQELYFQESTLTDGTDKTKVPDKAMIEKEKQLLQKFCPILINYLNGNVDLQMTAIYGLQVFCYGADFPKGRRTRKQPPKFSKIHFEYIRKY
jgi:translation initiation factor 4G